MFLYSNIFCIVVDCQKSILQYLLYQLQEESNILVKWKKRHSVMYNYIYNIVRCLFFFIIKLSFLIKVNKQFFYLEES